MKKFKKYLILLPFITVILLVGCPNPITKAPSVSVISGSSGQKKDFHAFSIGENGNPKSVTITAGLIKQSSNLDIYLKKDQTMSISDIDYISTNFDTIYPTLIDIYGTHTDIDRNEKVIILLYDINTEISPETGYVAGLFNPYDLNGSSSGNSAEILYVESQVQGDIEDIFSTIVHEFQHLINWNMNAGASGRESDLWLNEALSASSEILVLDILNGSRFGPMIPAGRYITYAYPENEGGLHDVIRDGNYFYSWDYFDNNVVLADYATSSLFMYWVYSWYGTSIIKNISQASLANRGRYTAVESAFVNETKQSELTWDSIMFNWLIDNEKQAIDGTGYPNDSMFGYFTEGDLYGGDLEFPSKIYSGSSKSINLSPGDAVLTSSQILSATGSIIHLKIANRSKDLGAFITLNTDKNVVLENHPTVEVDLPQSIIMPRSIKGFNLLSPPDIGYKIIPFAHIQTKEK